MEQELFSYAGWDSNDIMSNQYYSCVFKKDFGPFKEGDSCQCIAIDIMDCTMIEYDKEGTQLRKVNLSFAVKEG
jgi:putative N-acetylmannosamine-6-phosphate epimerase